MSCPAVDLASWRPGLLQAQSRLSGAPPCLLGAGQRQAAAGSSRLSLPGFRPVPHGPWAATLAAPQIGRGAVLVVKESPPPPLTPVICFI